MPSSDSNSYTTTLRTGDLLALGATIVSDRPGDRLENSRLGSSLSHGDGFRYLRDVDGRHQPDRSKPAFEELYDRAGRRVLLHLARRMHDIDAATELWAECWAVAFAGWSRCKARSEGEAEAWIFGIARNQLSSYYRSGQIASRTLDELRWATPTVQESDRAEIELEAELAELRVTLTEALSRVPVMRRRAVELRVLEGLPYEQVAQALGCSEQTARAHVSRGLRQLERQMDRQQILELQGAIR